MKATARLITGNLRATAQIVGGIAAQAFAQPSGVTASARTTDEVGLMKYLRVTPISRRTSYGWCRRWVSTTPSNQIRIGTSNEILNIK